MYDLVLKGGTVVDPAQGIHRILDLAIEDGKIASLEQGIPEGEAKHVVDVTGKIVTPNLYIGIAVSGASQHLAGCSGSKNMIAINKDPDANIFKVSQYGVVGDYKKIIPPFTQKVKELLSS